MCADRRLRRLRGEGGFTMVEVLVAMVILAVGLLALEAMAIGAARQVAAANRTTEYTLIARDRLERALDVVRVQQNPAPSIEELPNGTRIAVQTQQAALPGGVIWNVTVVVTPPASVTNVQPVTLSGSALR